MCAVPRSFIPRFRETSHFRARALCGRRSAFRKARTSMPDDAFIAYWEKRNDELRNLGIKTVGLVED